MTTPAAATPAATTPAATTPAGLSARSRVEYARDWSLFTDWCAAADLAPLPAAPATVAQFLTGCPAAPATLRRRVAAIDHRHTRDRWPAPGGDPVVRAALGRPPSMPVPADLPALHGALAMLPSHGWTVGLFGRRDRALLVLIAAGATTRQLAAATAADLSVQHGTASLDTGSGVITLQRHNSDAVTCGPCAVGRWLRLLRLITASHSHRRWIDALQGCGEVLATSPHQCTGPVVFDGDAGRVPLLPRIDRWGYLDTVPTPVGARSLRTLSTALLRGQQLGQHRRLPPPAAEPVPLPTPPPRNATGRVGASTAGEWEKALERRRWQNRQAADIDEVLRDLEARTRVLVERTDLVRDGQVVADAPMPRPGTGPQRTPR